MGYLNMGAFISMVPPVGVLVGSIVIGWIVKKFDLPEHWTVSICLFFMVMVQLALCFLELLEENTWPFIILVGVSGFFHSFPWSIICSR